VRELVVSREIRLAALAGWLRLRRLRCLGRGSLRGGLRRTGGLGSSAPGGVGLSRNARCHSRRGLGLTRARRSWGLASRDTRGLGRRGLRRTRGPASRDSRGARLSRDTGGLSGRRLRRTRGPASRDSRSSGLAWDGHARGLRRGAGDNDGSQDSSCLAQ
jgi:hypothetical protein